MRNSGSFSANSCCKVVDKKEGNVLCSSPDVRSTCFANCSHVFLIVHVGAAILAHTVGRCPSSTVLDKSHYLLNQKEKKNIYFSTFLKRRRWFLQKKRLSLNATLVLPSDGERLRAWTEVAGLPRVVSGPAGDRVHLGGGGSPGDADLLPSCWTRGSAPSSELLRLPPPRLTHSHLVSSSCPDGLSPVVVPSVVILVAAFIVPLMCAKERYTPPPPHGVDKGFFLLFSLLFGNQDQSQLGLFGFLVFFFGDVNRNPVQQVKLQQAAR